MNINFEKIKFRNLMSYGEDFTEVPFKPGLDIITGKNGEGKSSINDSVFYALFGKAFRKVKTSSLINRINKKQLEVHLDFNIDGQKYRIIRGQSPAKFEIYIYKEDYELIPQEAATKDYQSKLEENILKLNESTFRQLVILGANMPNSKTFMELTPAEKEELFQILTDTSIFNSIKGIIKDRSVQKSKELSDQEYKQNILKTSLESERNMLEQMQKQQEDYDKNHKNNILETEESIEKCKLTIEKCNNALEKLKELKVEYSLKDSEYNKMEYELQLLRDSNNTELQEFNNKILEDSSTQNSLIQEINEQILDVEKVYSSANNAIKEEIQNENQNELKLIQEVKDLIFSNSSKIQEHKKEINEIQNRITFIEGAEKGAIECTSCSTKNYLVQITESEVQEKTLLIQEIKNIENKITEVETENSENDSRIQEIKKETTEKIDLFNARIQENNKKLQDKKTELESKVQEVKQEIEAKQKEEKNELEKLKNKLNSIYKEKEEKNKIFNVQLQEMKDKLLNGKRVVETKQEQESNLVFYENKLQELNALEIQKVSENTIKNIENKEMDYSTVKENINILNTELDNLKKLNEIVGAKNIKGQVIKQQIPLLNKEINYFLELFSLQEYQFIIDENFKERLISVNKDSEFNALSNGQKSRISFSIIFSFLRMIENRNGVKVNLLILDEVLDSSVDSTGREELLNILNTEFSSSKDIIIISHNDEIKGKLELFNRSLEVTKDEFSSLSIEDL